VGRWWRESFYQPTSVSSARDRAQPVDPRRRGVGSSPCSGEWHLPCHCRASNSARGGGARSLWDPGWSTVETQTNGGRRFASRRSTVPAGQRPEVTCGKVQATDQDSTRCQPSCPDICRERAGSPVSAERSAYGTRSCRAHLQRRASWFVLVGSRPLRKLCATPACGLGLRIEPEREPGVDVLKRPRVS
jgi:hypothetical protein